MRGMRITLHRLCYHRKSTLPLARYVTSDVFRGYCLSVPALRITSAPVRPLSKLRSFGDFSVVLLVCGQLSQIVLSLTLRELLNQTQAHGLICPGFKRQGRRMGIWVRLGTILIVLVVHIVLFIVFATKQRRERQDEKSLTLVRVPVQMLPKSNATTRELKIAPERPRIGRLELPPSAPSSQSDPSSRPNSIDWKASATAAAQDAVAEKLREERYRNFGPRKIEPDEPAAPSIFKDPKHKAGDIESDALDGVTRVYHSEHCFTQLDFPTLRDPGEELKPKINLPRCMRPIGTPKADGELFNHLKKEHPLPELKPGTEPGPLPERKDAELSGE